MDDSIQILTSQINRDRRAGCSRSPEIPWDRVKSFLQDVDRHEGTVRVTQIHGHLSLVGFPWEDLARLWHGVWEIGQLSRLRGWVLQPFLDAFIAEYGESGDIVETPLFRLLLTWNSIAIILTFVILGKRLGWTGFLTARAWLTAAGCGWRETTPAKKSLDSFPPQPYIMQVNSDLTF